MNTRRTLFAALAILTTTLACAVPGLPSLSPSTPGASSFGTPDTRLDMMVAETVSAALTQTQQAVPTPTTPPTSTPVPTATSTPEEGAAGSALLKGEDNGPTVFTDFNGGYELTVPSGWLAVRINEQEYLDSWLIPELSDPALQRSLGGIENLDPSEMRLFAFDIRAGHADTGFVTNINFLWKEGDTMSLENDSDLLAAAAELPTALPGLEVLSTELSATTTQIPIGIITTRLPVVTVNNVDAIIFQKQVFIKVRNGTLAITLSTTEALKEITLPEFDAMIETVSVSD